MDKTKLSFVAGLLELILACILMFINGMGVTLSIKSTLLTYDPTIFPQFNVAVFGLIASLFGLIGGIFAIKRRYLVLSIFGVLVMTVSAFYLDWYLLTTNLPNHAFIQGLVFGNLMILLSIIDLVLLFASKAEFT